jgi:hypothetical protein
MQYSSKIYNEYYVSKSSATASNPLNQLHKNHERQITAGKHKRFIFGICEPRLMGWDIFFFGATQVHNSLLLSARRSCCYILEANQQWGRKKK